MRIEVIEADESQHRLWPLQAGKIFASDPKCSNLSRRSIPLRPHAYPGGMLVTIYRFNSHFSTACLATKDTTDKAADYRNS